MSGPWDPSELVQRLRKWADEAARYQGPPASDEEKEAITLMRSAADWIEDTLENGWYPE